MFGMNSLAAEDVLTLCLYIVWQDIYLGWQLSLAILLRSDEKFKNASLAFQHFWSYRGHWLEFYFYSMHLDFSMLIVFATVCLFTSVFPEKKGENKE